MSPEPSLPLDASLVPVPALVEGSVDVGAVVLWVELVDELSDIDPVMGDELVLVPSSPLVGALPQEMARIVLPK